MKLTALYVLFGVLAVALLVLATSCIQKSATCFNTIKTSPEAPNHMHMWCVGEQFTKNYCTPDNVCHRHNINEGSNLAEPAGVGPHTHALQER
jgi:hypothetical protein